jgi:two-component system NtrC family sensor kinase
VLEPNGFQWLVAEDGQRGLDLAIAESPDLILLDLQMPRLDGTGMLKAMNEHGLKVPVVLMTFHGSEEIAVEVFRMGVVDYVIKPFNIDELLNAMERALTETRLRRERDELTERLVGSNLDLKRRVRELQALFGIGKSVTTLMDRDAILSRVTEAAAYSTSADRTDIYLLDTNTGGLLARMRKNGDEAPQAASEPATDQNVYAAMQMAQPLLVDQASVDDQPAFNALYVPVMMGDTSIGVMRVISRVTMADHQTQLLNALADYIAIGVKLT